MADTLTKQFLTSEIDFLAQQTELVFIEALERKYETDIEVEVFGETKKVHLVGHIDRIDSIGDRVRIIDYKSGKVADTDVQLRTKDETVEDTVGSLRSKKHTLQLMYYAFLYQQAHGVIAESSIISFISNKNQPFTLKPGNMVALEELLDEFPSCLGQLMEEIYDEEVPFRHDGGKMFSYCQYCD
jgi:CRISPR/Cas system-associated exonuclease Cas4 (RecB family)